MNFLKELENEIKEILNKDNVKRIGISNSYFEIEFFDKGEKTLKAGSDLKIKKEQLDCSFIKAGLPGFEPGKCWSQSPVPYHLAIAHHYEV